MQESVFAQITCMSSHTPNKAITLWEHRVNWRQKQRSMVARFHCLSCKILLIPPTKPPLFSSTKKCWICYGVFRKNVPYYDAEIGQQPGMERNELHRMDQLGMEPPGLRRVVSSILCRKKERFVMKNEQSSHEHPVEHFYLVQRDFSYLESQVTLALDSQGVCWISIPGACKALGLNARGQQQRIGRTPELAVGLRLLTLSTRGGRQRINCLRADLLALWLENLRGIQQEAYTPFLEAFSEVVSLFQEQSEEAYLQPSIAEEDEGWQEAAAYQLPLPLDEQEEDAQALVATALPGLGQVLVVTNYPEDRAIREATFARSSAWKEESMRRRPYYIASNEVRVSLGDPGLPLVIEDAQAALRDLQESTVLTARYILGRWHIAREQNQLAKEGSVLIHAEELLEWRGVLPHSRALYPGSQVRQIDGYEQKHLDQIHRDIKLLELFHLQGQHRILVGDQIHSLTIDGPYLRATQLQESESGHIAYFVAPGGWINVWIAATEAQGGLWVAELDRRIFKLHPHNDQIALRLALFLVEYWQMHLATGVDAVPLSMEELLTASMIPIDRANLTLRFAPRIEAALQKLVEQGIIGQARPQAPLLKQGYWGKAWLAMLWEITPPVELMKQYEEASRNRQQLPLLLPSPTRRAADSLPSRGRRRRKEPK